MKRIACLILLFSMLLSGCNSFGERIKEPVTFYYVSEDYQRDMNAVISSEMREASGHRGDLPYLLALYTMGPSTEGLRSPFEKNAKIIPTEHTESGIVLSVSDISHTVTDAEFTLASACLAMTCMDLTNATQVTIICEDRSITLNRDNLMLYEK